MQFRTHNTGVDYDVINGTCLQGYVSADYSALCERFGEPTNGDGYKVDAEWLVQFEDGTVATIYNYKDGKNYNGADGLEVKDITDWHIGGITKRAVVLVEREMLISKVAL
jgi:hypothetical protein